MQVFLLTNFNGSKSLLCYTMCVCVCTHTHVTKMISIHVFAFNEDIQIITVPKVHKAVV